MTLQEAEALARVECPDAVRHALKALAVDPTHKMAFDFIVEQLCGINRLSACLPHEAAAANWWNGRRYVGQQILDIVRSPIPEKPQPPERRMSTSERVRQRSNS
jgi:hypothetical protein